MLCDAFRPARAERAEGLRRQLGQLPEQGQRVSNRLAAVDHNRPPDRASLRLKTITWNNAPEVITLTLDQHYWPAYEVVYTASGWVRRSLE